MNLQKTFSAFLGPAVFLVVAGYVGCNKVAAVSMICLATAFNGFSFPGYNTNHIDIASRYVDHQCSMYLVGLAVHY